MKSRLHALHVEAGLRAGYERTCYMKVAYDYEVSASFALRRGTLDKVTRVGMAAYPCAFCRRWHLGWKRTEAELLAIAYPTLSTGELAAIPTSLLLRDVVAHGCDRFDREQLCARCRDKWAEVDRRLPTREVKP